MGTAIQQSSGTAAWLPSDHGMIGWTGDPYTTNGTTTAAAGLLYLWGVKVPIATTVTNICLATSGTAGSGTSTGTFAGLYNAAGTLLGQTADIGALLVAGAGNKIVPLTAAVAVPAGFYWVGFVANLSVTQPSMRSWQNAGASIPSWNYNLAAAQSRTAVNGTGLVALPGTITPSSNTITGAINALAGLS